MKKLIEFYNKYVGIDGLLHIVCSIVAVFALSWIRPIWLVPIFALLVGVSKELYDKFSKTGTPDWKDLLYDAIGVAIGMILVGINYIPFIKYIH